MSTITVLRPSAVSSAVGWTATPSGTLNSVTSDDSDATYALWSGSGSTLILPTPADAPPAGERRHQVRLRMRGEDGNAWGAVRLASGSLVAGAAASFPSSPATVTGAWGFGAPPDGSTVLSCYVTGQSSGVKIEELYLDVDTRLAPTFTPEVLDSTGSSTTTVTDTAQPSLLASDPDLDGLSANQYHYWVTFNGSTVWDSGVISGPSGTVQTDPLANGSYVAHFKVWSTLGASTAYASDEETVSFTVIVGAIPVPDNPTVDQVDGTPFYHLEACAPFAGDLDDDQAWIEIQRVDCPQGGYLDLPGTVGAYASTPDPGTYADLSVEVYAQRDDNWNMTSGEETLASQYDTTGNNRSWRLSVSAPFGKPFLGWSADGTSTLQIAMASDRPNVDGFGRCWIRADLVTNNAGNWTVTWYTKDADGAWVQFGNVNTGSTVALFNSTAPLVAGAFLSGGSPISRWEGRIYSLKVSNGAGGSVITSPDFTGRPAGTTSFIDAQSKTWTVHAPATITSDQRLTTVAILGPLATDECAEYTDYTHPRTGIGATCGHPATECCSYYRARTLGRVDGQLQISNWSDVFDPGIPRGLIALWPSTNASIPTGWNRVTDLDSKYMKGIATNSTEPGATGGAPNHTHTLSGSHTHDLSHTHTTTGSSGTATGTQVSTPNSAGTANVLSSHTHTVPTTGGASVTASGAATPSVGIPNNDPSRLMVIHIESDGSPLGIPASALGLMPDISATGWTDYATVTGRFIKGAAAAADGGGTGASALDSHTHTIGAHSHTGPSHTHSSISGSVSSANSLTAGGTAVLSATSHTHPVSAASTAASALGTNSSASSGAAAGSGALEPPYRNVRVKQNTSGSPSLPVGLICAWRGSLGSIPKFWQLSDGTNGTLDMSGRYPKAATSSIGTTGGTLTGHSHTTPSHSDHSTTGHSHTQSLSSAAAATGNVSTTSTVTVSTGTHTHTAPSTNSTTPTVGSSSSGTLNTATQEPPYEEVAFVQLMQTPTAPPTPDETCLDWSDDYHLLRSRNADGPLWAQVGGIITWDRDRPLTSSIGVMGTRMVSTAPPGGRNFSLTAAVSSETELSDLLAVLNRPLVLVSPSDSAEAWAAPISSSVKVIQIGRIRQVTASFIGTGPEPAPQLADVGV